MLKAMILSAGLGTRLSPLTDTCPKPLLKIGKETLLSNTINFLEQSGVKQVIINVHYLGAQIVEYLNKKKFKIDIIIINEKEKMQKPLDTGGGILNAIKYFQESFLCINPDTIWNYSYTKELKHMENFFLSRNKKCTLLLVNKAKSFDKSLKGDFNLEKGFVTKKNEKDLKYIYTGLQIINPEIFSNINDKIFSMHKIWSQLINNNELSGFESNINFLHVSTLDIYKKLNVK